MTIRCGKKKTNAAEALQMVSSTRLSLRSLATKAKVPLAKTSSPDVTSLLSITNELWNLDWVLQTFWIFLIIEIKQTENKVCLQMVLWVTCKGVQM